MFKLNALVLATVSVVVSASACAGVSASTVTRAEVTAEYQRARAAGELPITGHETSYTVKTPAASSLTRAEVQAEYVRARAAGELRHVSGYASAADAAPNVVASTLTRADVINEYLRARSTGELAESNIDFGAPQLRRAMR